MNEITHKTTQCIICLKEATEHCGYVVDGDNEILSGWCKSHSQTKAKNANLIDNGSEWKKEYGIEIRSLFLAGLLD